MKIVFHIFILFFLQFSCFAQAKQEKIYDSFDGGKLLPKPPPVSMNKQKTILKILKYDNRGLMHGNPCVAEETAKLGFEYLIVCNKDYKDAKPLYVFFYNLGTRIKLTLKNGPGWSIRLKKKIKACKRSTADFVW
jgi:hypothetical protein